MSDTDKKKKIIESPKNYKILFIYSLKKMKIQIKYLHQL